MVRQIRVFKFLSLSECQQLCVLGKFVCKTLSAFSCWWLTLKLSSVDNNSPFYTITLKQEEFCEITVWWKYAERFFISWDPLVAEIGINFPVDYIYKLTSWFCKSCNFTWLDLIGGIHNFVFKCQIVIFLVLTCSCLLIDLYSFKHFVLDDRLAHKNLVEETVARDG